MGEGVGGEAVLYYIGIDIGGTKTAVVLGSQDGESMRVLDRVAFPTEAERGPAPALARVFELVPPLLAECGGEAAAIGVSSGGPLDSQRGIILSPPNLPGWDDIHIVDILEERFHIPAFLQNDANASALAEWRWGAAKGCQNAVFLTFGTGMGAGLILGGRLHEGACGLAGEVGHIRLAEDGPEGYGKAGSFEGFCSGGSIARMARSLAAEVLEAGGISSFCVGTEDLGRIDARLIAEAARAGDQLAADIFRASGRFLGRGLAVLIDILNPEVIVIGGMFMRCRDLFWPDAEAVLLSESLGAAAAACRVVSAALGEAIGDMAALAVACNFQGNS
jgi:glucokinase